jgi:hypothetical protein
MVIVKLQQRLRRSVARSFLFLSRGSDQQSESPDRAFVVIGSVGRVKHRSFRVAADRGEVFPQGPARNPTDRRRCHLLEERLKHGRGPLHQIERKIVLRT